MLRSDERRSAKRGGRVGVHFDRSTRLSLVRARVSKGNRPCVMRLPTEHERHRVKIYTGPFLSPVTCMTLTTRRDGESRRVARNTPRYLLLHSLHPLASPSCTHPPIMPLLPTPNAPTSLDELKELLKDDNKVKVAGTSTPGPP